MNKNISEIYYLLEIIIRKIKIFLCIKEKIMNEAWIHTKNQMPEDKDLKVLGWCVFQDREKVISAGIYVIYYRYRNNDMDILIPDDENIESPYEITHWQYLPKRPYK